MNTLDKKDQYIKELVTNFQTHIELCNTNFIKYSQHFAKAADKQSKGIDELIKRIKELEK